jgi:2-methylisocitrate lyase-like PEP mutase family enzyme
MTASKQSGLGSLTLQEERMTYQARKAEQFRGFHVPGRPLVLFNIWDAGSARAVATAGAKAIATSSWSVANAHGLADGERIPLALVVDNLRRIVAATDLPVTIDLESGYGDTMDAVEQTIQVAIEAGAVGCNLEDSFLADGKLRQPSDQADRIRYARQTADAGKNRFFINARTLVWSISLWSRVWLKRRPSRSISWSATLPHRFVHLQSMALPG